MWIWPLYLHVNQKSEDDDDDDASFPQKGYINLHEFLFAFLFEMGSTLKGKNLLWEKILSFKS